jgi:hypothetical protein
MCIRGPTPATLYDRLMLPDVSVGDCARAQLSARSTAMCNIFDKLGVRSRAAAASYGVQHHIVHSGPPNASSRRTAQPHFGVRRYDSIPQAWSQQWSQEPADGHNNRRTSPHTKPR